MRAGIYTNMRTDTTQIWAYFILWSKYLDFIIPLVNLGKHPISFVLDAFTM